MDMTIGIISDRLAEIRALDAGGHSGPPDGWCVMEAVAYVTGEPWSDHPRCACPVVTRYAMRLNDRLTKDERQRLIPYIVRIAGSRATREVEQQRAYLAATRAVKRFAPLALDARGLGEQAAALRALPDITDRRTALGAKTAAAAAAADADADAAAAYAAADAAAYAAADAADAAADAADAADAAAAADAADAADAAADAAYAAADAADARRTVVDEALACLDAMLAIES